jgi:hypothetical protein
MLLTNSPRASEKLTLANTDLAATKALLGPSILSKAFMLKVFSWGIVVGAGWALEKKSLHIAHHFLYFAKYHA